MTQHMRTSRCLLINITIHLIYFNIIVDEWLSLARAARDPWHCKIELAFVVNFITYRYVNDVLLDSIWKVSAFAYVESFVWSVL